MAYLYPVFLLLFFSVYAGEMKSKTLYKPPAPELTITKVDPTPEPNNASVEISYPEQGDVVENPVSFNFRIRGFSLGTRSSFPRSEEIADHGEGQSVHIMIDDEPYAVFTGPSMDPFDEDGDYYQQNYQIELPKHLSNGMHVVRMVLARSYGESLKSSDSFAMSSFFVGEKKGKSKLSYPILTYNEPSAEYSYAYNTPILLDFLVTDGILSKTSYGVKVEIDGKKIDTLYEKSPYYIYGLKKGRHKIRLSLVNRQSRELGGFLQESVHLIRVQ